MALKEIMNRLMDIARRGDPHACAEPMSGTVTQVRGLKFMGDFGDLSVTIDEPVIFGGTGSAPNPAEVALAALGASMGVTLRCYAAFYDVPVENVTLHLRGALDNRGFFGTESDIRPGFPQIDVRILLKTSAPAEAIRRLIDRVERCAPVLDLVRNATPVRVCVECDPPPSSSANSGERPAVKYSNRHI